METTHHLSVRELQVSDIAHIADYWAQANPDYLRGMGADPEKLPSREQFTAMLSEQLTQPYEAKKAYCTIWEADGQPIGHCNVNKIEFGESAYMHLHLWDRSIRQQGMGVELVKMSLPYFFKNLQLKRLFCEPYALNPAPNKTLEKVGFELVKEYVTTPGPINFEQPVKLWCMTREADVSDTSKVSDTSASLVTETLKTLFRRDLLRLKQEIESYREEQNLWIIDKGIANSAGNLCLHLTGNLRAYIGAQLGQSGYIRNRDAEFSLKNVPRAELLAGIDETIAVVEHTLDQLTEAQLQEEYPQQVFGHPMTTGYFLIHLATHLGYHLGQVNYHRRLLEG